MVCIVHEDECPCCALERTLDSRLDGVEGRLRDEQSDLLEKIHSLASSYHSLESDFRSLKDDHAELIEATGIQRIYVECGECHGMGEDQDLSNMGNCWKCRGDGRHVSFVPRQTEPQANVAEQRDDEPKTSQPGGQA